MAIQDVILRLKMIATGVDQQVDSSERIADNYARASASAQKLGATNARAAAFAGSRSPRETVEYGMARGSMGATGASARDFANQAQGLGGLVRLYATYAANVFAVTAAFRALSDAMNTANMVRGLDQLGAASGRALGNLSKQLVEVTDGAISLRDSMVAVAQTSSAGMSSQNILRLGAAAQKASQALGISMADALNRLSRGITKLEPELLDELGVFIRIDDAAEKYARTLGKTVGSLTEFERRQGFALAVLEQSEDKFGKIKLDTNPYDKLAASLDNLTKKILDFVNIGLGPVVNFLAQTPSALGAALLGIGTLILKQALPVLTQYREGLKKTREASLAAVAGTSSDFMAGVVKAKNAALKAAEDLEEEKIRLADAAEARITELRAKNAVNSNSKVRAILKKASMDVTAQDIAYLNQMAAESASKGNQKAAAEYQNISKVLVEAKDATIARGKAQADVAAAEAKLNAQAKKDLEKDLQFRKQITQAARDDLAVVTAQRTKQQGLFSGIKKGFADIIAQRNQLAVAVPILDEKTGKATGQTTQTIVKGLNRTEAALGLIRVATTGVSQAFVGLLSRLGTIGIVTSLAVATFETFNSLLSSSKKEAENFRKSQDLLAGSIKNVGETLDALRNKKPDQILSIESIQARANAFNDLSDSLIKTTQDFDKLIIAQGKWEKGLDATARFFGKTLGEWGKGLAEGPLNGLNQVIGGLTILTSKASETLFGKGSQAEFSDKFAESIISAIALAESEVQQQNLTAALQNIFGNVDLTNLEKLKEGVNAIGLDELRTKSELAAKAIKKISDEANVNASILTSLKESIKTVSKEIDGLNTSLLPTDRLGKIGVGFIDTSNNLLKALGDTKNSIVAIKEVTDSMQLVSLLPPDLASSLINDKKEIAKITTQLGEAREAVRIFNLELAKLGTGAESQKRRKELVYDIQFNQASIQVLERQAANITSKYGIQLQRVIFEEGVQKLNASLKFGLEQAAINAAKAYLSVLGQVGGETADQETKLALQELNIQRRLIEEQYQSRLALERNTLALEKSTTAQDITALNVKIAGQKAGATPEDTAKYQQLMEKRQTLDSKETLLKDPNIKKLEQARKDGTEYEKRAAMELGGLTSVIFGKQIQLAQIAGQEAQVLAQGLLKKERELADQANKRIDLGIQDNQIKLDELNTSQNLLGVYDSSLAAQKLNLETTILQQNAQKDLNRLVADEQVLLALKGKPDVNEEKRLKALALIEEQKAKRAAKYIQDDANARLKARFDEFKNSEEIARKDRENAQQILQANNEIAATRLDASLQYLQVLETFGVQDKISAVQQRAKVDLLKEELQFSAQLVDLNNRQLNIDSKRAYIKLLGSASREGTALAKEADREQALLDAQRNSILASNEARKESIRLQAEQNLKLEQQNYFLEQAGKLSSTLSDNFGNIGARLGQAIDVLGKVAKNIEDGRIAQENWNKRAEEFGEFAPPEFIEEGARLQKKAAQDELDRNALTLNSTKKLFKEKTAAYKAFGALEKAYHIARLIMSAKEIATQIASTVSFVTSSITRQTAAATEAGVLGVKAVINAVSTLPPPLSFAAGAAMTALVAGLLAQIGKSFRGGSGGGRGAVSTEDINKVQGSAMDYNSRGELVQVRPGVLGDTSAKSDSVAKSIAMIEKYTIDGMSVNDRQLQYLKLIEKNTKAAAVSIYAASGLRSGNLPGASTAGIKDTTLGKIASTGGMLAGGAAGFLTGTAISAGGYFLGGAVSTLLGEGLSLALNAVIPGLGLILGSIIGKAFVSEKVETTINQSGLVFSGSLEDLANNIDSSVKGYIEGTKKTTRKYLKGLLGSSKSTDPLFETVDLRGIEQGQLILDNLRPIFKSSYENIVGLAEELGFSQERISASLKTTDFKVNLKDLKTSEEIGQALYDGINAYLDTISSTLFAEFKDFQQEGEGLFQTVNRVVYQFKLVNQGLQNIGLSTSGIGKTIEGYGIANTITEIFGGMEAFIDKTENFRKGFLSETEQIVPVQKMLVDTFKDLKISGVDTVEEFKLLVQSIKPVDEVSAGLLNTLLDLAPAFERVYKEVDTLLETLRKETITLTSTLTPEETVIRDITIKTGEYIEKLKAAGIATEQNVRTVVEWSKASALSQLRANLKTAFDDRKRELESNISALKKVKETLTELKNSLLVGELSPLTPLQQYGELFGEYQKTLLNVKSTDAATADAAKQAFPQLAKQLLDAGKGLFASTSVYQNLVDTVSSDLETTGTFIDSQISEQERLLKELDDKYLPIFGDIAKNTQTTSDKLAQTLEIWNALSILDTTKLANDVVSGLAAGTTSTQTITDALAQQLPIAIKATAEAIKIVNGDKTVDFLVEKGVQAVEAVATKTINILEATGSVSLQVLSEAATAISNSIPGRSENLLSYVDQRAVGGPVIANSPYIVGEAGPELFIPRNSGTIIPNNKLSNNGQNDKEILYKLDQLIEAVVVSNNQNAQAITNTLEKVKSKKTWESGQVYGRVLG